MIRISQIRLQPVEGETEDKLNKRILKKAASILGTDADSLSSLSIVKRSVDARKKPEVFLSFTVDVKARHEERLLARTKAPGVSRAPDAGAKAYQPYLRSGVKRRILIAGAGPAGLFAAYILAMNGLTPVLLERGRDVDSRTLDVQRFWETGELSADSNVQFGEGGAGTFSDGKLNTGIKDRSGRIEFVAKTFVKMGASSDILTDSNPHVGTDVLRRVVKNLRQEIIRLGGEVHFKTRLTGIECLQGRFDRGVTGSGEELKADALILAIGHSARDTFMMLHDARLAMEYKDFAVGYRVIHPQSLINLSQYGPRYASFLGAAAYKLAEQGVYSFCMCPGGYVVNSSSEGNELCVNGMSYSKRDSAFANSAIVMMFDRQVCERELAAAGMDTGPDSPLAGMHFQRLIEERAYRAADGFIPVQTLEDFRQQLTKSSDLRDNLILPDAFKGRAKWALLSGILPACLEDAFLKGMTSFGGRIEGFDSGNTLICAVESRTSSPVRILRGDTGESSVTGIYPCGEGAGYAGGIVSAAVDGIKTAEKVIQSFS